MEPETFWLCRKCAHVIEDLGNGEAKHLGCSCGYCRDRPFNARIGSTLMETGLLKRGVRIKPPAYCGDFI